MSQKPLLVSPIAPSSVILLQESLIGVNYPIAVTAVPYCRWWRGARRGGRGGRARRAGGAAGGAAQGAGRQYARRSSASDIWESKQFQVNNNFFLCLRVNSRVFVCVWLTTSRWQSRLCAGSSGAASITSSPARESQSVPYLPLQYENNKVFDKKKIQTYSLFTVLILSTLRFSR